MEQAFIDRGAVYELLHEQTLPTIIQAKPEEPRTQVVLAMGGLVRLSDVEIITSGAGWKLKNN